MSNPRPHIDSVVEQAHYWLEDLFALDHPDKKSIPEGALAQFITPDSTPSNDNSLYVEDSPQSNLVRGERNKVNALWEKRIQQTPLAVDVTQFDLKENPLKQKLNQTIEAAKRISADDVKKELQKIDPKTFIASFLEHASINGQITFNESSIELNNSPNLSIEQGAAICFGATTIKDTDESFVDLITKSIKGQPANKSWFITMRHPIVMGGFSAWGLDLSRITLDDENHARVEGLWHPFHKNIMGMIEKSPLGPLFPHHRIDPVRVADVLNLKPEIKSKNQEFDEAIKALDQLVVSIESPPANPRYCKPSNRHLKLQMNAAGALEAIKAAHIDKLIENIKELNFYWQNFEWPEVNIKGFVIKPGSFHISANIDKTHIAKVNLSQMDVRIRTPDGLDINISGNLQLESNFQERPLKIVLSPSSLKFKFTDHATGAELATLGGNFSATIGINDQGHPTLKAFAITKGNIHTQPFDPGLTLDKIPLSLRYAKLAGNFTIIGNEEQIKSSFNIHPSFSGFYEPDNKASLPYFFESDLVGDIFFDHKIFSIKEASLNLTNLFFSLSDWQAQTSGMEGSASVNYQRDQDIGHASIKSSLSGLLSGPNNEFQATIDHLDSQIEFEHKNNKFIPQIGQSQLDALVHLVLPNNNSYLNNLSIKLTGHQLETKSTSATQSASVVVQSNEIAAGNMTFGALLEGSIGIEFDSINPRLDWTGLFNIDSSSVPLNLQLQTGISMDSEQYVAEVNNAAPLLLGDSELSGSASVRLEGLMNAWKSLQDSGSQLFDKVTVETQKPFELFVNSKQVAKSIKVNGSLDANDPRSRINMSALVKKKYPLQVSLKRTPNPDNYLLNWRALLPPIKSKSINSEPIIFKGYSLINVFDMLKKKAAPFFTEVKTEFHGDIDGPVGFKSKGRVSYNPQAKKISINFGKSDAPNIFLGPLQIKDQSVESKAKVSGSINYRLGEKDVSLYNFKLSDGEIVISHEDNKWTVAKNILIAADSAWGILNGIIYCGGSRGCYAKAALTLDDNKHLEMDNQHISYLEAYLDKINLTKQHYIHWLIQQLKRQKLKDGGMP